MALLKRYFEETDRDKKFEDRMAEAISRIPANYAAACIQSALRRCWIEYEKMVEAACSQAEAPVLVWEGTDPEHDDDSDADGLEL